MKTLREVLTGEVTAKLRRRGLTEEEIEKKRQDAAIRLEGQGKSARK